MFNVWYIKAVRNQCDIYSSTDLLLIYLKEGFFDGKTSHIDVIFQIIYIFFYHDILNCPHSHE